MNSFINDNNAQSHQTRRTLNAGEFYRKQLILPKKDCLQHYKLDPIETNEKIDAKSKRTVS